MKSFWKFREKNKDASGESVHMGQDQRKWLVFRVACVVLVFSYVRYIENLPGDDEKLTYVFFHTPWWSLCTMISHILYVTIMGPKYRSCHGWVDLTELLVYYSPLPETTQIWSFWRALHDAAKIKNRKWIFFCIWVVFWGTPLDWMTFVEWNVCPWIENKIILKFPRKKHDASGESVHRG